MNKPIVSVYLNQKIVFDLLAMLQGGISTVTTVSKKSSDEKTSGENISAGFGLSEAFSTLLRINLSGEKNKNHLSETQEQLTEERVHTPTSLFFQLKKLLRENGHIHEVTNDVQTNAGDFVEFEGSLKRNPIIETMDSLKEILSLAMVFESKTGKNAKSPGTDYKKILQQMEVFTSSLKSGQTTDLTVNINGSSYTAVLTLETTFLNDPMMSDLVDGRFKVLGKVINCVDNNIGSISLLRKTALSKMPSPILLQTFQQMSALGSVEGFSIPELIWEIKGPEIHVLPIAIYA